MKKMNSLLTKGFMLVCLASMAQAQTQVDLRTQTKTADLSNVGPTKTLQTGTVLPGTCSTGEVFFKTDAAAGENIYGCTAPDIWSLMSSSGVTGSITVRTDGGTIGSRQALNLISSPGLVYTASDDGTSINLTPEVQSSYFATLDGVQGGSDTYCAPASASANNYSCTEPKTLVAYTEGMRLLWRPDVSCTGGAAITLDVDANGAKRIFQSDGLTDPTGAQCVAGSQLLLAYDASLDGGSGAWRILTGITALPPVERMLSHTFTGHGSPLIAGEVAYLADVPYACTIDNWAIALDQGTATVDIWMAADGTGVPTTGNSITASTTPAISTGTRVRSGTLTGWTTQIPIHSVLGFELSAVSSATTVNVTVGCIQ